MTSKRKPTLKQIFNAWIKYQKKSDEKYQAEMFVRDLAKQADLHATELIEYKERVYRITITNNGWWNNYEIKQIASASELPIKS
jgi:hypothetical protein